MKIHIIGEMPFHLHQIGKNLEVQQYKVLVSRQNNRNSGGSVNRFLKKIFTLPVKAEEHAPHNLASNPTPRCNSQRNLCARAPEGMHAVTQSGIICSSRKQEAIPRPIHGRMYNSCILDNGKLYSSENDTTAIFITWMNLILSTNRMKINGFATIQTYYGKEGKKGRREGRKEDYAKEKEPTH